MSLINRCIKLQAPRDLKKWTKIMLLGEAPGEEEEKQGVPYVGRSGKLLDSLLNQAGIERANCVVTNVFHVRPPNNEIMAFFTAIREEADPIAVPYPYKNGAMLRDGYGAEMTRLMNELRQYKPKVVVALGATALWAMTGRFDISQRLGVPMPIQSHIVLPVYHPAYLLRQRDPRLHIKVVDILKEALDYAVVNPIQGR